MLRASDYVVVVASEMNFRKQESGSILRRYANASPPVPVLNGGAIAATGCELKVFGIRKFRCGRESSVSVMAGPLNPRARTERSQRAIQFSSIQLNSIQFSSIQSYIHLLTHSLAVY